MIYRHFVSGLTCKTLENDLVEMRSSYLVINTSKLGQSVTYQTGWYHDLMVRSDGAWRFKSKRVIYDTSRIQTALAAPI